MWSQTFGPHCISTYYQQVMIEVATVLMVFMMMYYDLPGQLENHRGES